MLLRATGSSGLASERRRRIFRFSARSAHAFESDGQIVQHARIIRLDRQSLIERIDSFIQPAHIHQDQAQIVDCFQVIRLQFQRGGRMPLPALSGSDSSARCRRCSVLPDIPAEFLSTANMRPWPPAHDPSCSGRCPARCRLPRNWAWRQRPFESVPRRVRFAPSGADQTKPIKRVGVVLLPGQNLAVPRFRLGEAAGLMQLKRPIQDLVDRHAAIIRLGLHRPAFVGGHHQPRLGSWATEILIPSHAAQMVAA